MATPWDRAALEPSLGHIPYAAFCLQTIQDSLLECMQPVDIQGIWVDTPIPGPLGDIEIYRIAPQWKEKEGCGLYGSTWLISLASVSSILFDKM